MQLNSDWLKKQRKALLQVEAKIMCAHLRRRSRIGYNGTYPRSCRSGVSGKESVFVSGVACSVLPTDAGMAYLSYEYCNSSGGASGGQRQSQKPHDHATIAANVT